MEEIIGNLEDWFAQRPSWLQDAARRIIQKGPIDANDLDELVRLCKQEAGITDPHTPQLRPQAIQPDARRIADRQSQASIGRSCR